MKGPQVVRTKLGGSLLPCRGQEAPQSALKSRVAQENPCVNAPAQPSDDAGSIAREAPGAVAVECCCHVQDFFIRIPGCCRDRARCTDRTTSWARIPSGSPAVAG